MEVKSHIDFITGEKVFFTLSYIPRFNIAYINYEPANSDGEGNVINECIFLSLESAIDNQGTYSVISQFVTEFGKHRGKTVKIGSLELSVINNNTDNEDDEEVRDVMDFLSDYAINQDFWQINNEIKTRTGKWFE